MRSGEERAVVETPFALTGAMGIALVAVSGARGTTHPPATAFTARTRQTLHGWQLAREILLATVPAEGGDSVHHYFNPPFLK